MDLSLPPGPCIICLFAHQDRKVAGHYRDLLYKMLSIDLGASPTKANKRKVTELMEERNMLDMSLPDSECKFVWEVTQLVGCVL